MYDMVAESVELCQVVGKMFSDKLLIPFFHHFSLSFYVFLSISFSFSLLLSDFLLSTLSLSLCAGGVSKLLLGNLAPTSMNKRGKSSYRSSVCTRGPTQGHTQIPPFPRLSVSPRRLAYDLSTTFDC